MNKFRQLGRRVLFPHILIIVSFAIISAAGLVYIFLNHLEASWMAYVLYGFSAYSLIILVIFLSMVLPKQYKFIRKKIMDNPWGNRYLTDAAFRTHVSLYLSLGINVLYAGLNIFSYFMNQSKWFLVLTIYYIILSVMRFLLVRYAQFHGIGKDHLGELKRARLCSIILLNLNFVLSGSVLMILYQNKGYEYPGILIYAMAAYTFYTTIFAIINLVKYRKYKSPVMTASKIISLSSALVSMLSLETAMFSQFGQGMSQEGQRLMIELTGAGISVAVIGMSAYMIIRTSQELEHICKEKETKKEKLTKTS